MHMDMIPWYILGCLLICCVAEGFKILVIYPSPAFSHQRPIMALTEYLVQKGHELYVVSPNAVPGLGQNSNYTYVDVSFSYKYFSDEKKEDTVTTQEDMSKWAFAEIFKPLANIAAAQFRSEAFMQFQRRIESESVSFDVVIVETIFTPYACPVTRKLTGSAPIISMSTLSMISSAEESLGSIPHSSFVPSLLSDYTDRMSLWQKIENWISDRYIYNGFKDTMEAAARRFSAETYGPEFESTVDGCWKKISLSLIASNSLFFYPRLLGPNVIEVGPLHLKPPKKLPKDLQDWLDGAEKGVIYFSMGSNFKSKSLSRTARANFFKFFEGLPPGYRALWKDEAQNIPKHASNILTREWFPQESILAHPKIRVFITQGGLQSFQEAVHFGVPMVGIPWYGDQASMVSKMVDAKIGARLLPKELESFEKVKSVIESVLHGESILENMRRYSAISRDLSSIALEEATFWVEHVARHGGAEHLRPSTADTTLFHFLCLDIIAVILAFTLVITLLFYYLCKLLFRVFLGKSAKAKSV